MALRGPLPLTEGKTAMAFFSVALDFVPTLRQMGHRGIAVQCYAFDRACQSALAKYFQQRHQLVAPGFGGEVAGARGLALLELMEWAASVPCSIHDA